MKLEPARSSPQVSPAGAVMENVTLVIAEVHVFSPSRKAPPLP